MEKRNSLSCWLQQRCRLERLSLRAAATRTGLSHATIADIIKGHTHSSPGTIKKLARAFGGGGRLPLEDHLFTLAGYRSERESGEQGYLNKISLLSPDHQHIVEILVTELANLDKV